MEPRYLSMISATDRQMKVLLLTDSLSLPRSYENGTVLWEDIYFNKLRHHFFDIEFILVAMGGATITQLHLTLNYYKETKPDIVILQSGIVDCAPRALGQLEQQIVIKLRMFRLVHPFIKGLRKIRNITYTKPKEYEETLLKIKNSFPGKPFISIGILPGCEAYDKKVPGVSKRIEQYNAILKQHSIFIDNRNFPRDGIINDFHHLNEKGHQEIFDRIFPLIIQYRNPIN